MQVINEGVWQRETLTTKKLFLCVLMEFFHWSRPFFWGKQFKEWVSRAQTKLFLSLASNVWVPMFDQSINRKHPPHSIRIILLRAVFFYQECPVHIHHQPPWNRSQSHLRATKQLNYNWGGGPCFGKSLLLVVEEILSSQKSASGKFQLMQNCDLVVEEKWSWMSCGKLGCIVVFLMNVNY